MKLSSWPFYDEEQLCRVKEILQSGRVNYWTGDQGKLFEKEFSEKFNSKYSIALANGSLALSCAYLALELQRGDEIITTSRTFIATASSAVLLGLKPVFVDVDIDSGAISVEEIEKSTGPLGGQLKAAISGGIEGASRQLAGGGEIGADALKKAIENGKLLEMLDKGGEAAQKAIATLVDSLQKLNDNNTPLLFLAVALEIDAEQLPYQYR